ncbi:hypothetical protein FZ103_07760 [Streptomonospora sp. PA3]|uniref:hypothetical protein n=1 Tax=Streptomonospora sp. PA3 TaxID=2607326 RepID=UPI0012DE401B|nr:hypothetical protein [Streptomonospora sp. PA3]MUL41077.1 hypothetical protein [Streptomonospora sp. PA3]
MRWLAGVLAAAAVVVVGVQLFGDAFHTPPAFCPDDADGAPHDDSRLDSRPPEGPVLYAVGEDGMWNMTSSLDGRLPADFPYRPALICQYRTMTDEQISVCPTSGGGEIPVVRTRYHYKVYGIPGKDLRGAFDLPGIPLCEGGITTRSEIPAEPDYTAIAERTAPLLREE